MSTLNPAVIDLIVSQAGFSQQQAVDLLNLNLAEGQLLHYPHLTYQILAYLRSLREKDPHYQPGEVFQMLANNLVDKYPNDFYFQLPTVIPTHSNTDLELSTFRAPLDVTEGAFQCPRCKSQRTISREAQVRSADEPSTFFIRCAECSYNWKQG